ncbi:MAG: hypothetical protein HY721_04860, partial [Planctomycetes bacterium]|nr:hypothetical protein [Planctomycetota bacterium]
MRSNASMACVRGRRSIAAVLTFVLAGCGGVDLLELRDREIGELRFENERKRESLIANLAEIDRIVAEARAQEADRGALTVQVAELSRALRTASESLAAASAQRDEVRKKLSDLEEAHGRLRETADKVKSVASASVGELADLRLKRKELEDQVQVLTRTSTALRAEKEALAKELEEAKAELVRERAVARSLQEGSTSVAVADAVAEEKLRRLEREVSGLKSENMALQTRVAALAGESPVVAAAPGPQTRPEGAVYRKNPAGLLVELGGILDERYRNALRGEIAWDSLDLAVLGAAAVVLLACLLFVIRVARGCVRRRREPRGRSTGEGAVAEAAAPAAVPAFEAVVPAARAEGPRVRKPPRRPAFSAVISNRDARAQAEAAASAAPAGGSTATALEDSSEPAEAAETDVPSEPAEAEGDQGELSPTDEGGRRKGDRGGLSPTEETEGDRGGSPDGVGDDPFRGVLEERPAKLEEARAGGGGRERRVEPRRVIGARSW